MTIIVLGHGSVIVLEIRDRFIYDILVGGVMNARNIKFSLWLASIG